LNHPIRLLAIILLKNGIDKYWRQTAKHAIKPPEKQLIRSRLLQGSVDEEDKTLGLHNALVVAKVVRIDYPNVWPDVIPDLINITRASKNGNPVHLGGALKVLLQVVKELSTARLRASQTALQQVTPELVQLLGEIYTERTAYWLEYFTKGSGDEDEADYSLQNSLLSLKILRRLVTAGYEHPHADQMVQGFWSLSQSQFDQFLRLVAYDSSIPAPFQALVGKHLLQFTKLHIDVTEVRPSSFPLLPNSIPLVRAYWNLVKQFSEVFEKSGGIRQTSGGGGGIEGNSSPKHEGPLSEKLALKGLLLLRSCVAIAYRPVQTFKYRSQEDKALEKQAIETVKNELLTKDLLLDIVQVTISKLFIFRKSDLEAWEEDPEEWEQNERNEGSAFEWAVRPCAERLLVDLLTHYKDLGQPLLTYCELATKVDMDIVTKEAAYCALGCAAPVIHESFDFDRILTNSLVKDVQIQDTMAKLLRRRIPILISQWIGISITRENRKLVYEIIRHLLNPADEHNDEVVRLTAARELRWIALDFGFHGEDYLPFAAEIFDRLTTMLLEEVSTDETKLAILDTIRCVVQRMENHVAQFGDAIMMTLPKVWASVGTQEYMLKQSALAIMTELVYAMQAESAARYQGVLVPLLRDAMNPDSELHLHLIEESATLWQVLLMHSVPPLTPELVQLVEMALPLLEYDTEVAVCCAEIVKSYIVLAPGEMLSDGIRRPLLEAVNKTLSSRSRNQSQLGTKSIEFLLRAAEELGGGAQGVTIIVRDMLETGILGGLLEGLHSVWESEQTTGPNRKTSQIDTIKRTDYFALLARIAVADPTVFVTMLASTGGGDGSPQAAEANWAWLAPLWFSSFDCMADIERQKLSCLALTRLCELPSPMQELVLGKLQDYLTMWTTVIRAVSEEQTEGGEPPTGEGKVGADSLVWHQMPDAQEYDKPLDVAEREFVFRDPLHRIDTYEFVKARLQDLVARAGGEQGFQENWANNVDQDVLVGFQRLSG